MNHVAVKVFSWAMLILGAFAILGALTSEPVDGFAALGGVLFMTQAVIALKYADKISNEEKASVRAAEIAEAIRRSRSHKKA